MAIWVIGFQSDHIINGTHRLNVLLSLHCINLCIQVILLLVHTLFKHPHLLVQVARVQKAQFLYRLDWLVPYKFPCDKSLGWTGEVHPVDPFHSLQHEESVFFSRFLLEFKRLQCPQRSRNRVARCRLYRLVSSLFIGGGRLFSTLFSVMLSIAVLTNEVWITRSVYFLVFANNGNTI